MQLCQNTFLFFISISIYSFNTFLYPNFRNMVGIIANSGQILEAEALKAAHFIDMCNRRATPLIFLQNSDATSALANDSYDLKPRGSMSAAVATACVPKISVTLTGCFHEDYLLMVRRF